MNPTALRLTLAASLVLPFLPGCSRRRPAPVLPAAVTQFSREHRRAQELEKYRKQGIAALPALRAALKDHDADTRSDAALLIGELGPAARIAAEDLVEATRDENLNVRLTSARALGYVHTPAYLAVPALLDLIREKRLESFENVVSEVLARLGEDALPLIIDGLNDSDPGVQAACVRALGTAGANSHAAARALCGRLPYDDSAADALVQIGLTSLPALSRAALDPDDVLCLRAARAIRRILPGPVEDLLWALNGYSSDLRLAVPFAIAMTEENARKALPDLIRRTRENRGDESAAAARALALIDGRTEKVSRVLFRELSGDDPGLRWLAGQAILHRGPVAAAAVIAIAGTHPDVEILRALAACRLEATDAVPALLEYAGADDAPVRAAVIEALAAIAPAAPKVPEAFARRLTDPDSAVRDAAAAGLRLSGTAAHSALVSAMTAAAARPVAGAILREFPAGAARAVLDALRDPARSDAGILAADFLTDWDLLEIQDGLRDLSPDTRLATVLAVRRRIATNGLWIEGFAARTMDADPRVESEARAALAKAAPAAIPVLVLKCWTPPLKSMVEKLIRSTGAPAAAPLAAMLRVPGHRAVAEEALMLLGEAAVPALAALRVDPNAETRQAAVEALGRLGKNAPGATRELAAALRDVESVVRITAARELGLMGPDAADAAPELEKMAAGGEPLEAQVATEALRAIRGK